MSDSAATPSDLRLLVEAEARAAKQAASALTDAAVDAALAEAAALVHERRADILRANEADYAAAQGRLDAGMLDRLRLDEGRVASMAEQVAATAALPPLERVAAEWTLPNGLHVTERRIPIGVVGANFEARPNVALDVAAQLLKSLNAGVLRTGGAALRSVTVIVDEVVRPALERAGLPAGAIGLVRSADREGARILVSMPDLVRLVVLRGSGETTAALARLAAEHGVRTHAHAEGGGVLYIHAGADPAGALRLAENSLDRLGVCNRLNLALVDAQRADVLPGLLDLFARRGLTVRGTERARALAGATVQPLDRRLGHDWTSDPERVSSVTLDVVDTLEEAVEIANDETSGLAAAIVTEDETAALRFLDLYRGTAAYWQAPTRFTDGFALTGAPETGINVDWTPGPRGPVTYRDLWLRQYRGVGDGSQHR